MIDFEFRLDKGNSPLVYCQHPIYDIHRKETMNTYTQMDMQLRWPLGFSVTIN